MSKLAKELNDKGVVPDMAVKGQIHALIKLIENKDEALAHGFTEDQINEGGVFQAEIPLSDFGITEAYLEEHPEGSDRGGYVPTVFRYTPGAKETAYYMELDGEWH